MRLRKKKQKEHIYQCENPECDTNDILVKKSIDESDIFWLSSKIDWGIMPTIVRRLNETQKMYFLTKMLVDAYDIYQCNKCDWFKLVKR